MEKELIEELADLEHKQWAHWTSYFIKQLEKTENNPLRRKALINCWKSEIKTPYNSLSEKEKESDRVWARKTIKIIDYEMKPKFLRLIIGEIILIFLALTFFVIILYVGSFNDKLLSLFVLIFYFIYWCVMVILK